MEIPKKERPPLSINPGVSLIYSIPKAGKTTICSKLPNHLFLEVDAYGKGADKVTAREIKISNPKKFDEALDVIEQSEDLVADYLIVDTITILDEWSEIAGTYHYMQKPQGKKFNRMGGNPNGEKIIHTSPQFETVHEMPNGYGYKYSRKIMVDWYQRFEALIATGKVKHVILLSHIKDKMIETKTGDIVDTIDINLTGKVKSIYASKVDTIGYFYRKEGKGYLNFNNEYKTICGGRCNHLNSEILLSEKQENGEIKTFWEKVFLPESKN